MDTAKEWGYWGYEEVTIFNRDAPWFLILAIALLWNITCCHHGYSSNVWRTLMSFVVIQVGWMIYQGDGYTLDNFLVSVGALLVAIAVWWWYHRYTKK